MQAEENIPKPTVPKFKFDALVAHSKRQNEEIGKLRAQLDTIRLYESEEIWFWDNTGDNDLESLACPVVIDAGELRALVARPEPEGWKLMPETPTPEMLLKLGGDPEGPTIHMALAIRGYRELLKVAPRGPVTTPAKAVSATTVEELPVASVSHPSPARPKPTTWDIEGWNCCLRTAAGAIRHLLKHGPSSGGEQEYNYEHCLMIADDLSNEVDKRKAAFADKESQ